MSDNDQQPRRETGTTWSQRWGRSIAIAALPLAFVAGSFLPNSFTNNADSIEAYQSQSPGGIEEVIETEHGTFVEMSNGDVETVAEGGSVTEDQSVTAADMQRFTENVTMESQELRRQVDAGEISSEQAEEELARYTASEFAALNRARPSDEQDQAIDEFATDALVAGRDELISVLVERLVNSLLGGEGPDTSSGPRTTIEGTSQQ
jgi:hypothetical protein